MEDVSFIPLVLMTFVFVWASALCFFFHTHLKSYLLLLVSIMPDHRKLGALHARHDFLLEQGTRRPMPYVWTG